MNRREDLVVPGETGVGLTLDQLAPGEQGVVVHVDRSLPLGRRLLELGLTPGKRARVLRNAFLGDPIQVQIEDICLSLRRYEAALVRLERQS